MSWLGEYVELPADLTAAGLAERLTAFDLKLEEFLASGITGPLVAGRVLDLQAEEQKNGRVINWCRVDVGAGHNLDSVPDAPGDDVPSRGIVCGAHNFGPGDLVVVALPGTELPVLGFEISARKTYGHLSDGMICSHAELGQAGDSAGIVVLDAGTAEPGDDAIVALGLDDVVLDLEVNPDRAYALSLRGVARDAAIALGTRFTDPADQVDLGQLSTDAAAYPASVADPSVCGVFTTSVVTGFDPTRKTPDFIVRRLEQCGMRSISLAVDISNYVMLELGQPNHAYDRAKLNGPIVVRCAREGERLTTLDDVERTLTADDLVIADDAGAIGLAGVMGAAHVEVDDSTTDIVIEAPYFDAATIFRMARRHKIISEASKRNERGIDSALQQRASARVAELFVEYGGGRIEPGFTQIGSAAPGAAITISTTLPSRVTGVDIDTATAVAALEDNGCTVEATGEELTVAPPSWRPDLVDPYDLVEEVLRVVGYDKVPSVLPAAPAGTGLTFVQQLRRRAGFTLAGAGLIEIKTFPFAGASDFDRLGFASDDVRRRQVLLENPLSEDEPGLTTTLLTGVLRAAELNIGRGHSDVQLTEIGRVFWPKSGHPAPIYPTDLAPSAEQFAVFDEVLPDQPTHVASVLIGSRERAGWSGPGREVQWSDAVAIARSLANATHVQLQVRQAEYAPWHPGRCAELLVADRVIGHAGELHPRVAAAYGLPGAVAAFELNLDNLIDAAPRHGARPEFSTFPVAKEDLAFVVDADATAESVRSALAAASAVIESVRLFDVYTSDQLGDGRKSLAFALRLRAPDRTLTDEDLTAAREAAIAAAQKIGATLRA